MATKSKTIEPLMDRTPAPGNENALWHVQEAMRILNEYQPPFSVHYTQSMAKLKTVEHMLTAMAAAHEMKM